MKVRNWATLKAEIERLQELYPAPRPDRHQAQFNKYPARVPVKLPDYKIYNEQHVDRT